MTASQAELFHEATRPLGGRLERTSDLGALGYLLEEYRGWAVRALPGHVCFDYVASSDVNAFALTHGGKEIVGVTLGAGLALYELFLTLMCHPGFAGEIGSAPRDGVSLERLRARLLLFFERGYDADVTYDRPRWFESWPKDAARRTYGLALAHSALDFLIHHELAHLELGHLEWLEGSGRGAALLERRPPEEGFEDSETSRACEVDADRIAAAATVHRLHKLQAAGADPGRHYLHLLADPARGYRIWARSIGMLFFLFGLDGPNATEHSTHPHPYLRLHLSEYYALLRVAREAPDREAEFQSACAETTTDVTSAWMEMAGHDFVSTRFLLELKEIEPAYAALIGALNRIDPELEAAAERRRARLAAAP